MKSLLVVLSLMLCCLTLAVAAPARIPFTLTRDGQPACTIVIAKEATRAAQFAAYELQWHLKQISGAEAPIARDDQPTSGACVLVGESTATQALGLKGSALGKQEYVIRFAPQSLVLIGRDKDDRGLVKYDQTPDQEALNTWPGIWDEQGTMYAVYDFLERYCNVRWLNPTETGTDCPKQATLIVTGSGIQRAPFFKYRYAAYPSSENYDLYTGLWPNGSEGRTKWEAAAYPELHKRFEGQAYTLAKRGWNMLFRLRHREGGEVCPGNHSLYGYYGRFWEAEAGKEAQFEGQHPDWFAQGYQGKPPQMCYTSRGLIQQVAKDACEYFETGNVYPGAQAGGDFFCVEPMDNDAFCKCADCQKLLTKRDADSPFFSNGRHSDYFFNFVNEVAKKVYKTHPDKRIVCLAYMSHAAPPERVKLEPNVVVQYCFACHRLNFDRASYEHEVAQLRAWRALEPKRPLYLWLYYTFPVEIANNGNFHCFPGFFAKAIGEQFDLFKELKLSGMFHCGYGQEVEAYLTYRLMDDPALKTETVLDEYFTRLYGPAAGPMRKLYDTIEQTYGNPANYPEGIASKRLEGHHHQTEEVAWGYLGNEGRMAELAKLMEAAKAAAQTPAQKQRVALFELGTWDYMISGRKMYMEHAQGRYGGQGAALRVPFASDGLLEGEAAKMDRTEALTLTGWRSRIAEPTRRKVLARVLQDGEYLYLQLEEKTDAAKLKAGAAVTDGDYWQVLVSAQRDAPAKTLLVSPTKLVGDLQASMSPAPAEKGLWRTCVAVPLKQLASDGSLYLNIARRAASGDDEPIWCPTFGQFESPSGLRQLVLDQAETIPTALPSAGDLRRTEGEGLIAHWPLNEGKGAVVTSTDPARRQGKLVNGATWVKEDGRAAVRLEDSRHQYLDFGTEDAVNLTGPLTMLMWVKYEPTETWYPALLGKGYETNGTYGLHLRQGNTPWFEIDAPDGKRQMHNPTDLSLSPGQWNHVAATYDGTTMRVYINGREAGSGRETVGAIRTNEEPLRFGWLGSYGYFNGCVREISVYNRALPGPEVFGRYLAGR